MWWWGGEGQVWGGVTELNQPGHTGRGKHRGFAFDVILCPTVLLRSLLHFCIARRVQPSQYLVNDEVDCLFTHKLLMGPRKLPGKNSGKKFRNYLPGRKNENTTKTEWPGFRTNTEIVWGEFWRLEGGDSKRIDVGTPPRCDYGVHGSFLGARARGGVLS